MLESAERRDAAERCINMGELNNYSSQRSTLRKWEQWNLGIENGKLTKKEKPIFCLMFGFGVNPNELKFMSVVNSNARCVHFSHTLIKNRFTIHSRVVRNPSRPPFHLIDLFCLHARKVYNLYKFSFVSGIDSIDKRSVAFLLCAVE